MTSACVDALGKEDDCEELTILRAYRDNWLAQQLGGQEDVREYYRITPQIVEKIKLSGDDKAVFTWIYDNMVRPCVELINAKQYDVAYRVYKDQTKLLAGQYL